MISRTPDTPGMNIPQQKLVSVKTSEYNLDIQFEASPAFLDFLLSCKQGKDIQRLYKVSLRKAFSKQVELTTASIPF